MTIKDRINNEYFDWMCNLVCGNRFSSEISYRKLFTHLHNTEFTFILPRDRNRADDGISLRYRFVVANDYEDCMAEYICGPCSVLEMMVALANRCEESIMDDPKVGNRTGQWFWGMINNLGLGSMTDDRFDRAYVESCVTRFLNREYEPNGKGGLFTVRDRNQDLRKVEIWYQLSWYLDSFI